MKPESLEEFLAWQAPHRPELIQGRLLVPGSVMFLYGEYSTWKSWLAMSLAHALADGSRWLHLKTTPTKVLLINAELPKAEYQSRWKAYLAKHTIKHPENLVVDNDTEMALDSYVGINNYIQWLQFLAVEGVIIDNLYAAMAGDLTKNTDANVLIRNMNRLRAIGIFVAMVHHSRQEQYSTTGKVNQRAYEMFGSSFLTNWADTILETRGIYESGYSDAITLTAQKHRLSPLKPMTTSYNFNRNKLEFELIVRTIDHDSATSNTNRPRSSSNHAARYDA